MQKIQLIASLLKDIENMVFDKNKKQYNTLLEKKQNKIIELDKEVKRLKKILHDSIEERNQIINKNKEVTKERDSFKKKAEENKQVKNLKEALKTKDETIKRQNNEISNLDLSLRQIKFKKRVEINMDVVFVEFLNIMEKNIPGFQSLRNTFNPEVKLAIIRAINRRKTMEGKIKEVEKKIRKKYNGSFSDFFKTQAECL